MPRPLISKFFITLSRNNVMFERYRKFLPVLTRRSISDAERSLHPLDLVVLVLVTPNPKLLSGSQFNSSVKITSALVALIVQQQSHFSINTLEAQCLAKSEVVHVTHQAQVILLPVCTYHCLENCGTV